MSVDCLGFELLHCDDMRAAVECDNAKAYLVQDAEPAVKDRPQLKIKTAIITSLHEAIASTHPTMLHPNAHALKNPRGSLAFAVRNRTDVCVIFRQRD